VAIFSIARSSIARLAFLQALALAITMVAILSGVYLATARLLATESDQLIMLEAQSLKADFHDHDPDTFISAIADRAEDPWVRGAVYELRGPRGDFLAGNVVILPDLVVQHDGWVEFEVALTHGDETAARQIRAQILDLGDGFKLLVGHDVQDRQAFRAVMLRSIGWAVGAALLFGLFAGWWLGRRIARAARAISNNAAHITEGTLSERLPLTGSGDEIDGLVSRFNELLTRIESLTSTMRTVLDSTAHDLRGHLNRIRGAAQAAQHIAGEPAMRVACDTVLLEIDRLGTTLQGLLRIALAESGTAPLEEVDLSRLVAEIVEFYQPAAESHALTISIEPQLTVRGHRQLLTQAFANLLDNAIKYAPNAPIIVQLIGTDSEAIVTVADAGPGIPAEQRQLATQRFGRLPGSSGLPGSGLGLSLVAAVARLHHAALEMSDAAPGLKITLSIPRITTQAINSKR
jgi:signal transduction histidine kinase